ncbi:hypothetical protein M5K25_019952 [Dendrobium thyrsiflorum]|uniref:Uncharacterized protein n=1 Tax=Dendrobium thyrsiflorum TaxID=117978 RepID=A0ABD0UNJ9_DENTH
MAVSFSISTLNARPPPPSPPIRWWCWWCRTPAPVTLAKPNSINTASASTSAAALLLPPLPLLHSAAGGVSSPSSSEYARSMSPAMLSSTRRRVGRQSLGLCGRLVVVFGPTPTAIARPVGLDETIYIT